jgi:hypothetical protein
VTCQRSWLTWVSAWRHSEFCAGFYVPVNAKLLKTSTLSALWSDMSRFSWLGENAVLYDLSIFMVICISFSSVLKGFFFQANVSLKKRPSFAVQFSPQDRRVFQKLRAQGDVHSPHTHHIQFWMAGNDNEQPVYIYIQLYRSIKKKADLQL